MLANTLLHPAVVHFPIALLLVASGAGIAYLLRWRRADLRVLTWWTMGLGYISLVAAVLTGLFSQGGLPPDAPYRSVLNVHTTSGFLLLLVYGDLLYRRWLYYSRRRPTRRGEAGPALPHADLLDAPGRRWYLLAMLLVGAILVVASGWLGGQLVYRWGVNVG